MQHKIFKKKRNFSFLIFFILLIPLFLPACSYLFPKTTEPTQYNLFSSGQEKMSKKKFKQAQEVFQRVLDETTDNELRIRALMNLGDSFFENGEYEEAKFQYKKFLELYPAHELAVRAQYQLGMCDFLRMKVSTRDQTYTKNAIDAFQKVIDKYPKSIYAKDSKKKRDFALSKIAEHELEIGKFYFKQDQYHAAIYRFNELLKKYPDLKFVDEILYYLGESYYKEQSLDKAKKTYEKLISEYPKSKFARYAKRRLDRLK